MSTPGRRTFIKTAAASAAAVALSRLASPPVALGATAAGHSFKTSDGYTLRYDEAVIPRITVPTLIVGGRVSVVPWKSQVWINSQIKGSRLEIFEESEGGNHFMFMESPDKFNRVVREFMG